MSLQVWLPLNGDLHNLGLNGDLEFSAINTLTFNNDGKIGKSYQRATNNTLVTTGININSNLLDLLGTQASVAVWVKPLGTHTHYNGTLLSSGNWNAKRWAFGVSQDNTKVDVLCGGYNTYIDCSVPVNEWTHLCSTFNNGISKLYKNGIYIGELTGRANFDSDATNTCIGRETYAGGYFGFNGLINDVRIYDHCLSDKEVEEIAKGLVLHYKLDESNSNLLYTMPKSFSVAGYNAYQFTMTENLVADQTYTLLLWDVDVYHSEKTAALTGVWVYWGGGSVHLFNWAGPTYFTQEGTNNYHADYLVKTFTITSTQASGNGAANSWFNIYNSVGYVAGTLNMHIGAWKLEKGSVATPWKDSADNTIIYDSSGYDNNGTIVGSLNSIFTNPKYKIATYFSNSSYIKNTNFLFNSNIWTVTCWYFKSENPIAYEGIYCLSKGNGADANKKFAAMPNSGRIWYKGESGSLSISKLKINEWCFLVMTCDGTTVTVYENTINIGTFNASTAMVDCNDLVIGARSSAADVTAITTPYTGCIQDFRIYTTALTPELIKELYNTSTSIDKNGNIYSRELVEI